MNEFTLHPDVYHTGSSTGLVDLLKSAWTDGRQPVHGALHIVSGFGNYNGGVRFYEIFRRHKAAGGAISAFFAGSTSARLTSRQLVEELLGCGVDVTIVNRKRLLHAKVYGTSGPAGERLVVTSGNFTGPGMTQNVEAALSLDEGTTAVMDFSWSALERGLATQVWDYYKPALTARTDPAWQLLYDEVGTTVQVDDAALTSMVLILGHSDTARINAAPTSSASRGTQYFWLSKDCYGFFPALNIRNVKGTKATYSCMINLAYESLSPKVAQEARVTFEADNNLDFRLGTGALRNTGTATTGDLAVLTRRGLRNYELRIARQGSASFTALSPYATNFIGHVGKKYGYVPNSIVDAHLP